MDKSTLEGVRANNHRTMSRVISRIEFDESLKDDFLFIADGNAQVTESLGMILDCSGFGMGNRSNRYVMIIEDKVVKKLIVEDNPGVCDLTNADAILNSF